jgi:iron complex transport system substrate-binding protein
MKFFGELKSFKIGRSAISMQRLWIFVVISGLLLFTLLMSAAYSAPTYGHVKKVKEQPLSRIISLAPNLTEILCEIGAGSSIIAVDKNSDFPPLAKNLPVIAEYGRLNIEEILRLNPELVIAEQSEVLKGQLRRLEQLGIPVYLSRTQSIADIAQTIYRLGVLTGHQKMANCKAKEFAQQLAQLKMQYESKPRVKVFYQLWHKPLLTMNQHTIIHEVIMLCGGENIFARTLSPASYVSIEAVLHANPDVIIASDGGNWQKKWYIWPQLVAVRNRNLFSVPGDFIQRAGPRLLLGAKMLCHDLELARDRNLLAD